MIRVLFRVNSWAVLVKVMRRMSAAKVRGAIVEPVLAEARSSPEQQGRDGHGGEGGRVLKGFIDRISAGADGPTRVVLGGVEGGFDLGAGARGDHAEDQFGLADRAIFGDARAADVCHVGGGEGEFFGEFPSDGVKQIHRIARLERAGERVDFVGVVGDGGISAAHHEPAVGGFERGADTDGIGQDARAKFVCKSKRIGLSRWRHDLTDTVWSTDCR